MTDRTTHDDRPGNYGPGQPRPRTYAATPAGVLARKRKSMTETWLPQIATQPDEVFTPEILAELFAILQQRLPANMTLRLVPVDEPAPETPRLVDAAGLEYDGVLA